MTRIGIVAELGQESRVAATPVTVRHLLGLGYEVVVEKGAGERASFPNESYAEAGALIVGSDEAWSSEIVLRVNPPSEEEIGRLADGATLIGTLSPALRPELVEALASRPITALALDAVPRISRAQSMDVLSSMANIAGYGQSPVRESPGRRRRRCRTRGNRCGLQSRRDRTSHRPPA